jgi:aspergillopepsin I
MDLQTCADGTYNFGYIDDSQYTGEIAYTPAFTNKYGHRLFNASGYSIGSGKVRNVTITAIPDTGSSLVALPNDIAADYWSSVPGSISLRGQSDEIQYAYPCNSDLPDFNLNIGDQTVTVPGKYMKYVESGRPGTCIGGITGGDALAPFSIFGDVFLKSVFVIFDDGQDRVGFANGA